MLKALEVTGGLSVLQRIPAWRGLVTVNYHRIGQHGDSLLDWDLWSATQEDLDQHIGSIKRDCDIIGLDDLPDVLGSSKTAKSGRFALISFDDGYRDNFEVALPVLQSHGVTAAFFITTGFLDQRTMAWWDEVAWMVRSSNQRGLTHSTNCLLANLVFDEPHREQAIRILLRACYELDGAARCEFLNELAEATGSGRAPHELSSDTWLTWDMVRQLRSAGMSIGAHTVTHPVLARLSREEQLYELTESRLRLEAELGEAVTTLSYPVGRRDSFNQDSRAALTAAGFDWAFSFYGGYSNGSQIDRFNIPRTAVESHFTLPQIRSLTALPQVFARY